MSNKVKTSSILCGFLLLLSIGGTYIGNKLIESNPTPSNLTAKHEKKIRKFFAKDTRGRVLQPNPFTYEETEGGIYVLYTVRSYYPNGTIIDITDVKDFISTDRKKDKDIKITKKNF